MGRPAYKASDQDRELATKMASVGIIHEKIAKVLGISADTLTRHYREEMDKGAAETEAMIAGSVVDQAMAGSAAHQFFWLKCRGGWRETDKKELDSETTEQDFSISLVEAPTKKARKMPENVIEFVEKKGAKNG